MYKAIRKLLFVICSLLLLAIPVFQADCEERESLEMVSPRALGKPHPEDAMSVLQEKGFGSSSTISIIDQFSAANRTNEFLLYLFPFLSLSQLTLVLRR